MILIDMYHNLIFLNANFVDVDWNLTWKMYLKTFHSFDLTSENMKALKNFFSSMGKAISLNFFWKIKLIVLMFKFCNANNKVVTTFLLITLFWEFFFCTRLILKLFLLISHSFFFRERQLLRVSPDIYLLFSFVFEIICY